MVCLALVTASAGRTLSASGQEAQKPRRAPDIFFVPTPTEVVDAMLKVAGVGRNDIVYDLGCGDGRIVATAARDYGARGIGIDIDPQRVAESKETAKKFGVADKVKIMEGDIFEMPIGDATVVALYLLPSLNVKLMPKLMKELKPGTRIVSHDFDMQGQWAPEKHIEVTDKDGMKHDVYFWTIPKQ
jgi:ubiquinone/menaquinone biosynthesis C-methylase UbiE